MGKIIFEVPIANVSGKVFKQSHISHRTLYGVKHTYTWNPETVVEQTPGRLKHQQMLRDASRFASEIAKTEGENGYWHQRYRKEKPTMPFNAFVIKHKMAELKAAQKAEEEKL